MGSRAILCLWLSLAIALMIASDVAARDLAENSKVVDYYYGPPQYGSVPGYGPQKPPGYGPVPGYGPPKPPGYGPPGSPRYLPPGRLAQKNIGRGGNGWRSHAGEAADANRPGQTKP